MNNWWKASGDRLEVRSGDGLVTLADVLPPEGKLVVARLDGTRMIDADHAFYEFAGALRFPDYFGWNWAALSDCLEDLRWMPADGYLIVVENASRLLSEDAEDRRVLFVVLSRAVWYRANSYGPLDDKGIPIKVLLLCTDEAEAAQLRQEVADALGTAR